MRKRTISRLSGFALLVAQGAAAEMPSSSAITSSQIIGAMVRKHLPVEGIELTMPDHMRSAVKEPTLEIQQITPLDAVRSQLRVACHVRSDCMPFYATVRWSGKPGEGPLPGAALADASPAVEKSNTLRAGAHATLIIDDERVHIRVPVICVTGGTTGDKIKVTTTNHRQTFEATVLNTDELKGSL